MKPDTSAKRIVTRTAGLVLRRSQPCQLVAERGDGGIHDIVAERRAQGFLRGDRPLELLPVGAHCFAKPRVFERQVAAHVTER